MGRRKKAADPGGAIRVVARSRRDRNELFSVSGHKRSHGAVGPFPGCRGNAPVLTRRAMPGSMGCAKTKSRNSSHLERAVTAVYRCITAVRWRTYNIGVLVSGARRLERLKQQAAVMQGSRCERPVRCWRNAGPRSAMPTRHYAAMGCSWGFFAPFT